MNSKKKVNVSDLVAHMTVIEPTHLLRGSDLSYRHGVITPRCHCAALYFSPTSSSTLR
ncbi:hypothetical protein LguiA_028729 [Lonicera macranthoides]